MSFLNLCLPNLFLQIHNTSLLFTAHCRLTAAVYTTHSLCIKCAYVLVHYWLLHLTTPASHSTDFTDFYIPCRRYSFDQLLLWYDKGLFKHWRGLVFLFVVTSYNMITVFFACNTSNKSADGTSVYPLELHHSPSCETPPFIIYTPFYKIGVAQKT